MPIPAILAGLVGGGAGKSIVRPVMYLIAGLAAALAVFLVVQWDESRFEAVRADAAREKASAVLARDNHWKAEIEKANAEVARRQADAAVAAAAVSERAATERADLLVKLSELEKANAALPSIDPCGLDRARARLLRGPSQGARRPDDQGRRDAPGDPGGGKKALPRSRDDP